jgi:4-amino-4-deoxy-L-arabinose transferase-like glycosyltransferase
MQYLDKMPGGFRAKVHSCLVPGIQWLLLILSLGTLLRLVAAVYLGNRVEPTPAAYDQIYFHDVALNLLAGRGFSYSRSPWSFIQPGEPTAFTSFLYPPFLAVVYLIFGSHPLAARIIQALICSLLPWLVYGLVQRVLAQQPPLRNANLVALVAAGITAFYAYFIYFSATLMTDGPYLVTVAWALVLTLDLAEQPTAKRWGLWGLAVGLAILLRQVFMPIAGLLFVYIVWTAWRRVNWKHVGIAVAVIAAFILPWTVRNYLVFHRFLLLNSQAGQVFWNANHPDLGTQWEYAPMFPIPDDLKGADEITLNDELMRRGIQNVANDPARFVRLSLSRLAMLFLFYPLPESSLFSNIARTFSFGVSLPFMIIGLLFSAREWRRWLLLYLFVIAYILIHIVSWVQIRYRMPIDLALIPFAALAIVTLADYALPRIQRIKQAWSKA